MKSRKSTLKKDLMSDVMVADGTIGTIGSIGGSGSGNGNGSGSDASECSFDAFVEIGPNVYADNGGDVVNDDNGNGNGDGCNDDDDDSCPHTHIYAIDGTTICEECGQKFSESLAFNENRYYGSTDTRFNRDLSRHNARKTEDRGLHADLEPLGVPHKIIEKANDYYVKIIDNKIYRAKNRLSIVFACTYNAYADAGEPQIPNHLARLFKLNKKDISNGLKTFAETFRNHTEKKYIEPLHIVPGILNQLDWKNEIQKNCLADLSTIYNFVKQRSSIFNSSNPQSIAAGLVFFYIKLYDIDMSRKQFARIVNLTDITFTRIAIEIHRYVAPEKPIKF